MNVADVLCCTKVRDAGTPLCLLGGTVFSDRRGRTLGGPGFRGRTTQGSPVPEKWVRWLEQTSPQNQGVPQLELPMPLTQNTHLCREP